MTLVRDHRPSPSPAARTMRLRWGSPIAALLVIVAFASCSPPIPPIGGTSSPEARQPTPSPSGSRAGGAGNRVDGSDRTFDLDLVVSGSLKGEMVRATATAGLCDRTQRRIESVLTGSLGSRPAVVQFVTDRRAGSVGGAFVLIVNGHTYSSYAAAYTLGADLTSGSIVADIAESPNPTQARVSGSWRCL
jgi:hypothetical protein